MLAITLLLLLAITLLASAAAAFVPLPVEWGLPTARESQALANRPYYYTNSRYASRTYMEAPS